MTRDSLSYVLFQSFDFGSLIDLNLHVVGLRRAGSQLEIWLASEHLNGSMTSMLNLPIACLDESSRLCRQTVPML